MKRSGWNIAEQAGTDMRAHLHPEWAGASSQVTHPIILGDGIRHLQMSVDGMALRFDL